MFGDSESQGTQHMSGTPGTAVMKLRPRGRVANRSDKLAPTLSADREMYGGYLIDPGRGLQLVHCSGRC